MSNHHCHRRPRQSGSRNGVVQFGNSVLSRLPAVPGRFCTYGCAYMRGSSCEDSADAYLDERKEDGILFGLEAVLFRLQNGRGCNSYFIECMRKHDCSGTSSHSGRCRPARCRPYTGPLDGGRLQVLGTLMACYEAEHFSLGLLGSDAGHLTQGK
jgi:hypothetical protein